jgi:hypothetical protein
VARQRRPMTDLVDIVKILQVIGQMIAAIVHQIGP